MNDELKPSLTAKQKKARSQRKKKEFEPYEIDIKGKKLWQIYLGSKVTERNGNMVRILNRRTFADKREAMSFAEHLRIQKINHGTAAMSITDRLRSEAVEAQHLLEPHGISLFEAVRSFVTNLENVKKSKDINGAVSDYISGAKTDGRSARYLGDLRHRLGRFSRDFPDRNLASVTTMDLENWLRSLGVGAVSRNSFRRRLSGLFEYGVARGWCPSNPVSKVAIAREHEAPVGILSPEELARLLENAGESTLPYWAIVAFAGLRSAELERLEWREVHFDRNLVEVSAAKAKTAQRRFVEIQPALAKWLEPYRSRCGKICPKNLRRLLLEDRERAQLSKWPPNALRHSFATYHLTHFEDAGKTALALGHTSPAIVFAHYRELVLPQTAAKYWAIRPVEETGVIALLA